MAKIDLHIHSTASDGKFSPEQIVRKSAELGLTTIALADHDTVDGIPPFLATAKTFPGLLAIPAVEVSADVPHGEVHILGYFIDYTDRRLLANLEKMRDSRQERARRMIIRLRDLGMSITWERVREIAGTGSVGRPHIAQALQERGYISTFKEAFTRYIGRDGPAYVERDKITPQDAMKLILDVRGLPVFAHPFTVPEPEAMVLELKTAGLVGIEAYYDGYTIDEVNRLVSLAVRLDIIATGGSDYHGLDTENETLIGGVAVPMESVEKLIASAGQRAHKLLI